MAAAAARAEIEYYTDPLCCWSWAMEGAWRRLRYEYGAQLAWRYRLGGMLPDWERFRDPLNDVGTPAQMAPHWYHVRQQVGAPLDERLWHEDPPASSYPASVAVKAAALQGPAAGERYLRRLREAAMLRRRNIARRAVLLALAEELAEEPAPAGEVLSAASFAAALEGEAALAAFRDDVKEAAYRGIGRFPTLVLHAPGGRSLLLVGWRPYAVLREALLHAAPGLRQEREVELCAYAGYWGSLTAQEAAVALGMEPAEAAARLETAVVEGWLRRQGEAGRELYRTAPAPGS